MSDNRVLLTTDLDRTLLPNGSAPESDQARPLFRQLCKSEKIVLAYVTGRSPDLVREAIATYDLPIPDFAITDVGAAIYRLKGSDWKPLEEWFQVHNSSGWRPSRLENIGSGSPNSVLEQQPEACQTPYKISYFYDLEQNPTTIEAWIYRETGTSESDFNLIWSEDPVRQKGLLDILPSTADKGTAIHFLANHLQLPGNHILFAGDSGNDVAVFQSNIQSVCVQNAAEAIVKCIESNATTDRPHYQAKGRFMGMNGNYSAGILEGFAHFFPELFEEIMHAST